MVWRCGDSDVSKASPKLQILLHSPSLLHAALRPPAPPWQLTSYCHDVCGISEGSTKPES